MDRPLPTIVVTRPREQGETLCERLRASGFSVISLPLISIVPLEPTVIDKRIVARLAAGDFDWIVFTSANAASALSLVLESISPKIPASTAIAAQGERTAAAVRERLGRNPDLIPKEALSEEIVREFEATSLESRRVLIPGAAKMRDTVRVGLEALGAEVSVLPIYETVSAEPDAEALKLIERSQSTLVFSFFSPSALESAIQFVDPVILRNARIATIGPVTSAAAIGAGLSVFLESATHSDEGFVDELNRKFR